MKNRWSMMALVVLAGALAVSLALLPSAALAKEFKYAWPPEPPVFTVTYPGEWTQDSEKPNEVLLRTKKNGTIPIMEINCIDPVSADGKTVVTLDNAAEEYAKLVEKSQQTKVRIVSNKQKTMKDGTPAVEATMTWLYQKSLPRQSTIVTTVKDGKWVYVVVHHNPGETLWDVPRSLTFQSCKNIKAECDKTTCQEFKSTCEPPEPKLNEWGNLLFEKLLFRVYSGYTNETGTADKIPGGLTTVIERTHNYGVSFGYKEKPIVREIMAFIQEPKKNTPLQDLVLDPIKLTAEVNPGTKLKTTPGGAVTEETTFKTTFNVEISYNLPIDKLVYYTGISWFTK